MAAAAASSLKWVLLSPPRGRAGLDNSESTALGSPPPPPSTFAFAAWDRKLEVDNLANLERQTCGGGGDAFIK